MRKSFISTLVELAEQDDRVVLLTGDLGFGVVEAFQQRFPDRFFNVGVAEQNMIGVATGLAEAGFLPFAYSIATFATLRPYEFIRNGPALHRLPVRIVGVGGGVEYGLNGPTHYALEDLAIMRALPELTIVAPADNAQAASALRATFDMPGPIYFRLGKDDAPELAPLGGRFELGRLDVLAEGGDAAIVTVGPLAAEALRAADDLAEAEIHVTVAAVASVSPAPVDDLVELLEQVPLVVTVENHRSSGGVGSLVAEVAAERASGTRVVRLGLDADTGGAVGSYRFLLETHGLTHDQIAARVAGELERDGRAPIRLRVSNADG